MVFNVIVLFLCLVPSAGRIYLFKGTWDPYDSKYGHFPESDRLEMLQAAKNMFHFGYDSYMKYAFPQDELNPINCSGRGPDHDNPSNININDVLGDYILTLVDCLGTLAFLSLLRPVLDHLVGGSEFNFSRQSSLYFCYTRDGSCEPRKMHKYKIVLATAVIPLHQSLHVVWEQPPLDFNIVSYDVTLTSTTQGQLSTKTIKFGAQDFEFKNLKPDVYVARVEPKTKNGSTPCPFTESKPIRLVYTLEDNGPEFSMLNTALAVVGGTVLGAILLIFLIICWKKNNIPVYQDNIKGF